MNNRFLFILLVVSLLLGQTESEINQVKRLVKEKGLTEKQVIDAAKARGYSDEQIDAFKQKVEKNDNINVKETSSIDNNTLKNLDQDQVINSEIIINENELEIINESKLNFVDESVNLGLRGGNDKYFGYDIFKRDPAIFQGSSVGAVDPDYLIGPGDEIIVMLWGETQFRQELVVDREGFIFIPDIGQVFVNGLNLNLLESKLFKVLSQSYASLDPPGSKATTFLDVSLGNLRPLRIQVLGAVAQPGAYTVSPSATIFSSLYYFNGPTTLGSLRDIRLIRGGEEISKIDFYDFLLTGKTPRDEKLQLDDVIFIPNRGKTITIRGEINQPGIYELKDKETLKNIIEIAGGLRITAYLDRAQIDRIVPFEQRESLGMDRMFTDVNLNEVLKSQDLFKLQDGDRIEIYSVMDIRQNIVILQGAVSRPGSFDIGDSLYLKDLIQKADGISGDAYLERVDVVRTKPDYTEQLIKLSLEKVLENDPKNNIKLQSLDKIRVYGMTEMVPKNYVSIDGHVKRPGKYLLQENMTLYDLIFKSGGFIDEKFKANTYLERAELIRKLDIDGKQKIIPFNLQKVLNNFDLANEKLIPNDFIKIYSLEEIKGAKRFVSIKGNVKHAGRYELIGTNMTLQDLIFKAGGFDDKEFKATAFLDRADLIRFDETKIKKSIIRFNLEEVLSDRSSSENLVLKPNDKIIIYPNSQFVNVDFVKITGLIKSPGVYQLKNKMNIKDLIFEAGGISDNTREYFIEIARIVKDPNDEIFSEIIKLGSINNIKSKTLDENSSFLLYPSDEIFIRPFFSNASQRRVFIDGEVKYPGEYVLKSPNETITDIIKRSGGLKHNAYPYGSSFTRLNQNIRINIEKVLKNPKSKHNISLIDGDKINIAQHLHVIEVKGEVNNTGLYKYQPGKRIRSVIRNSGGFTPDAEKSNVFIIYPDGTSKKYSPFFGNHKVLDGSIVIIGKEEEREPFDATEYAKELTAILANIAQTISFLLLARN